MVKKICLPIKLKRLLLPALGGPKMAILIPERMTSPRLLSERCFWIWKSRDVAWDLAEEIELSRTANRYWTS